MRLRLVPAIGILGSVLPVAANLTATRGAVPETGRGSSRCLRLRWA